MLSLERGQSYAFGQRNPNRYIPGLVGQATLLVGRLDCQSNAVVPAGHVQSSPIQRIETAPGDLIPIGPSPVRQLYTFRLIRWLSQI